MTTRRSSLKSDSTGSEAPQDDVRRTLHAALRTARLNQHLTQQQLASRLGIRQRQVSDLERAVSDSRLSTIQDVARALDLELMLVPRRLIPIVEGLERAGAAPAGRPMYSLGRDEDEPGEADEWKVEFGGEDGPMDATEGLDRRPRGPRR